MYEPEQQRIVEELWDAINACLKRKRGNGINMVVTKIYACRRAGIDKIDLLAAVDPLLDKVRREPQVVVDFHKHRSPVRREHRNRYAHGHR